MISQTLVMAYVRWHTDGRIKDPDDPFKRGRRGRFGGFSRPLSSVAPQSTHLEPVERFLRKMDKSKTANAPTLAAAMGPRIGREINSP